MTHKLNAGEIAIAAAVAGTATNKQFVKALWSIRGELLLPAGTVPGFDYPIEVTRAALVNQLRTLPEDDVAGLRLQSLNPVSWVLTYGKPAEPKAKPAKGKGKGKPARTRAPKQEPALIDAGTPGDEPDGAEGEPGTGAE